MKLTAMLMQNIGVSADMSGKNTTAQAMPTGSTEKFDSYLEKADKTDKTYVNQSAQKEKPKLTVKKSPAQQKTTGGESADDGKKPIENVENTNNADKPDAVKPTGGQEKDIARETSESVNDEITKRISEQLGIPVSVIAEILSQLNLQPIDLTNPDNLNAFVQKLYKVDSAAELLNVPDVQNAFNELTSIMDDFTQTAVELAGELTEKPDIQVAAKTGTGETVPFVKENADNSVKNPIDSAIGENSAENGTQTAAAQDVVMPENTPNQAFNGSEDTNGFMGGNQAQNVAVEQTAENEPSFNPNAISATAEIEGAAVKLEAAKSVDTQHVIDQIVERMKVDVKADTTEIKITLKPEHLGDVTLKVSTQNGIVTAQFVAESQRVKEVIEAGFNQLRDTLRQQGIEISQLQVFVGNGEDSEQAALFTQEREISRRRIQSIVSAMTADEEPELVAVDAYGNDMRDSNVDYRA